jgi:hypothetical protein
MRTIALEEHFTTPLFVEGPGKILTESMLKSGAPGAKIVAQLAEIGDARVAEMDAAGLDMQVLSLNAPGVEQSETADAIALARDANDVLAAALRRHPKRFAGMAALPMGAPDKAADELERCVRQLGFKGANINGHNRGRYLDIFVPPGKKKSLKVEVDRHAFAYVFEGSGSFSGASQPFGVLTEKQAADGSEIHVRETAGNRSLVLFDSGDEVVVQAGDQGIRFLLVSGRPLEEPVAWHGPIVMNTHDELRTAVNELRAGTFIKEGVA